MSDGLSPIDKVKAEIAALEDPDGAEAKRLAEKLYALEEEVLNRQGLLDIDTDGMREHLEFMVYQAMPTIAIIPARGGSKGLPGKNIIDFNGKPLIHWTIKAAIDSGCFNSIIVSTDCDEIAAAAESSGATVQLRPDHLATDEAKTLDVLQHVLGKTLAETVVVLQPTSPLRTAEDIRQCVELYRETGSPVVSVSPAKPWIFARNGGSMKPAFNFADRRQDADFVAPNGAVYVFHADFVRDGADWTNCSVPYLMPAERSSDIDTHTDLVIAKALFPRVPV